jgi:hypothetical protein
MASFPRPRLRLSHLGITQVAQAITLLAFLLLAVTAEPDDTCVFATTADDIPPNIVILLDNGASMEEIAWHGSYDNSKNYSPVACTDVVQNAAGNGFCRDRGYAIKVSGGKYYLVEIPDSLVVANSSFSRAADGTSRDPVWTINGRTVTLPAVPASHAVDGVIDKAANFRFSKNYLNWIFGSNPTAG